MKVLDLFSGVGGFSKGFEWAGYDIIAANEIDSEISKSYEHNHQKTEMYNMPIEEFIEVAPKFSGKIDVIIGGPPCQGFSMAGNRNRRNNEEEDPRNLLFKDYLEVVNIVKPQAFIIENVKGMITLDDGKYFNMVMSSLKNLKTYDGAGYNIFYKVLKASDFGVPQDRERVIIFASEKKIELETLENVQRTIFEKYNICQSNTVYDAISDLNFLESGEKVFNSSYPLDAQSAYQKFMRKNSKLLDNHIATNHSKIALDRIKMLKPGESRKHLKDADKINSVHSGAYKRMSWDTKSKTVITRFDTPSAGAFIHPERDRTITPREAARLQSFPDDFEFIGSKTSIAKQIGNAVPPLLALYIAEVLLQSLGKSNT